MTDKPTVCVYVCTFRRNEPLARLLASLAVAAERAGAVASVGVVVVDDNPDGSAAPVLDGFRTSFERGIHYRHSGAANISVARNLGLRAAMEIGDWVAMTDDDVVVPPDWFEQYLDIRTRTGADAVTGPLLLTFDEASPPWLRSQPFSTVGLMPGDDERSTDICATGNSMVSTAWLRAHPDIRFDSDLGEAGGEDMVFYRRATAAGLDARYSSRVAVQALEPPERATLRYQLYRSLWIGNSQFVTNHRTGAATRGRLALRGGRRMVASVRRPVERLRRGEAPQWRFAGAQLAEGVGLALGAVGLVLRHR